MVQAQRLFGDPDYLLRVISRDLPLFQQAYDDRLSELPGVQRLSSTLAMRSVGEIEPLATVTGQAGADVIDGRPCDRSWSREG